MGITALASETTPEEKFRFEASTYTCETTGVSITGMIMGEITVTVLTEGDANYPASLPDGKDCTVYQISAGMGGQMSEGMEIPDGMERPAGESGEMPEGTFPAGEIPEMPEGMEPGQMPEGMKAPEGMELPDGMEMPEDLEDRRGGGRGGFGGSYTISFPVNSDSASLSQLESDGILASVNATYAGGMLTTENAQLGTYVVMTDGGSGLGLIIGIAAAVIVAGGAVALVIAKKKKSA